MLIVELDGPAAEVRELFAVVEAICRTRRRDDDRGGAGRGAARADLEGAQGGVRRDGPRVAELLRAGRRRAADEAARGARPHPRRSAERTGLRHRQRLSCRRRQPAPADLLRRAIPGQAELAEEVAGEILDLLRRGRRLDHRRARRRARTRRTTCRGCSPTTTSTRCSSVRDAFDPQRLCNPGKVLPTPRLCGEVPGPVPRSIPVEAAGLAERF